MGKKTRFFFLEAIKKEKKKKQNITKVLGHYDDLNEDSPHWLIDLIWSPESGTI